MQSLANTIALAFHVPKSTRPKPAYRQRAILSFLGLDFDYKPYIEDIFEITPQWGRVLLAKNLMGAGLTAKVRPDDLPPRRSARVCVPIFGTCYTTRKEVERLKANVIIRYSYIPEWRQKAALKLLGLN